MSNESKTQPLRCQWGIHKFTVWDKPFKIKGSTYYYEWQQRTCIRCGLVDERKI